MKKRILLLGDTGKMGIALKECLKEDYEVIGKNTENFDAINFNETEDMIKEIKPDIVINTIGYLRHDECEKDPLKALKLNTLYPQFLSQLSNKNNFLLLHFSSDTVFDGKKKGLYVESDIPKPINMYGLTKYGGDCLVEAIAKNYYILRLSILFGESIKNDQFIERMFQKIKEGTKVLRVADDVTYSPSYSKDIAEKAKEILESSLPFGIYHIINKGETSLFDVIYEMVKNLNLDVEVQKTSWKEFPQLGEKNINTPMASEKILSLRSWKEAFKDYTKDLKLNNN